MLHLHCLDRCDRVPRLDGGPERDVDRDDRTGHRSEDISRSVAPAWAAAARAERSTSGGGSDPDLDRAAVDIDVDRLAGTDRGPRRARRAGARSSVAVPSTARCRRPRRDAPATARSTASLRHRAGDPRGTRRRRGWVAARRHRGRPDRVERVDPCLAPDDLGLAHEPAQKRRFVVRPRTTVSSSAAVRRASASRAVRAPGDDLREHRVEPAGHLVPDRDPGVDPDARRRLGQCSVDDPAGRGQEAGLGVLGVEADLDRVARRAGRRAGSNPSGSPAAIRIWSATRSRPVTSSVTGCSTWSRVFISRK